MGHAMWNSNRALPMFNLNSGTPVGVEYKTDTLTKPTGERETRRKSNSIAIWVSVVSYTEKKQRFRKSTNLWLLSLSSSDARSLTGAATATAHFMTSLLFHFVIRES